MPASTKTYVRGTCKKCGVVIRVEVRQSVEALQEELAKPSSYECPGQHMEFGPMLPAYEWDWTPVEDGEPPSDEEYGRGLIQKYGSDRVYYLGAPAIGETLGIQSLHAVRDLNHMGFGDFASAEHYYSRHDSPRHTTRFYVKQDR